MKKLIALLIGIFYLGSYAEAQIIPRVELEEYAKEHYGETWKQAAKNLMDQLKLDKDGALSFSRVVESPGKSVSELYVLLNYWFVTTFNDANSVVQLSDKELGVIIATGYLPKIATHDAFRSYSVAINPVVRIDVKDERTRITLTIPYYTITKYLGQYGTYSNKQTINNSYPLNKKDNRKNTSSKALVMSHAYANVIMDRIEHIIHEGAVGNESQDW